jgi:hypothetical protein
MAICWCCGKDAEGPMCSCRDLKCINDGCGKCMRHCECRSPNLRLVKEQPAPQPEPEGERGFCKSPNCRAEIFWKPHPKTGKMHPYDRTGASHFATCPDWESFRRGV